MKRDAVLQVRIDGHLKKEAEDLYERLGISLADAVRMFVVQSIEMQGLPFALHAYGMANKYADPSLVDKEKDAWGMAVLEKYGSGRGCE